MVRVRHLCIRGSEGNMKSTMHVFVALASFCVGCQGMMRPAAPSDLSERLAVIEGRRLHARSSDGYGVSVARDHASIGEPVASANRPAHVGGAATGEPPRLLPALSMGDLGDRMPEEESDTHIGLAESPRGGGGHDRQPPLDSFWETVKRDVKSMPKDIWNDTKLVYANPVNLVILGGTYGGALSLRYTKVDRTVERHFNRRHDLQPPHHHFKEDWRDAFGAVGNPGTHFALAGLWYLVGQQSMDDKTYEVGKTLFSALAINGVTVMIGQAASYDNAPNGEYGTMPSGHTSSSFVFASVMHRAYGHIVGVPLYGLATLVAYERVEDGEHYLSDVVMGGVLGLVVGHSVADGRDPEFFGWKLVPWASPQGGVGVAFTKPLE